MTVTRTGSLTLPLDNAAKLFCDSATFRSLMGSLATPALAYAKCWLGDTDDTVEAQAAYPRTILAYANGQFEFKKDNTTGGVRSGPIDVCIEVPCPSDYVSSKQDAYCWLLNQIGAVFDEIQVLSSDGSAATLNTGKTHLNVTGISLDQIGPSDLTAENGNRILGAGFQLHWRGM